MPDDPRAILKAAGVECAEADKAGMARGWYDAKASHQHALNIIEIDDAAILALAHLVAKYKSAYEAERGHVLRGATGDEWVRRDIAEEEIAKYKWQRDECADELGRKLAVDYEYEATKPLAACDVIVDLERRWEEHNAGQATSTAPG